MDSPSNLQDRPLGATLSPRPSPSTNKCWFSSRPQEGQGRGVAKMASLLQGEWAEKPDPGLRAEDTAGARGKKPLPGRARAWEAVTQGGRAVSGRAGCKGTPVFWALQTPSASARGSSLFPNGELRSSEPSQVPV